MSVRGWVILLLVVALGVVADSWPILLSFVAAVGTVLVIVLVMMTAFVMLFSGVLTIHSCAAHRVVNIVLATSSGRGRVWKFGQCPDDGSHDPSEGGEP